LVLNTDGAIRAQDGFYEKTLESGSRRLRDDEEANTEHNAGQAHQHGPLFGRQEPKCDLQIGWHSVKDRPA
jgi:hypothetical protein